MLWEPNLCYRINIINTHSSQPILTHEDQATFHQILNAMYQPPSNLELFHNLCTGWEDEPMHWLTCYVRMYCQLLTLYVQSLNIPEEFVLQMTCLLKSDSESWFNETVPPSHNSQLLLHPWQVQSTTTNAPPIPTVSDTPVSYQ